MQTSRWRARARYARGALIAVSRFLSAKWSEKAMAQTQAIDGRVTAVRGAVLDVVFEGTALPPIDDALIISPGLA